MEFKDYYALLGVKPETPIEEIRRSYRKLARQYHPDVSKLPDAEKKFKEINEAWEVLKDPEKRAQYDALRTGGWQGSRSPHAHQGTRHGTHFYQGGFEQERGQDFSEFFHSIFGGMGGFEEGKRGEHTRQRGFSAKGNDIHAKIQVPITMAYSGGTQTIQLQIPTLTMEGKSYETKSLSIKIPAGVTQGKQIRLKEQGTPGMGGGPSGDLYIEIDIAPHPFFSTLNKDIHLSLPISPWEAALGATVAVPTLGGNVNLKIPNDAQTGQKLRLKGRGLPGTPPGDQYVILQIQVPKVTNEEGRRLYEEMAKIMPFNPRAALLGESS